MNKIILDSAKLQIFSPTVLSYRLLCALIFYSVLNERDVSQVSITNKEVPLLRNWQLDYIGVIIDDNLDISQNYRNGYCAYMAYIW